MIIWDLNTCEVLYRLELHKGHVQDVAFSPDEKYVATLGGVDDNKLVIWNLVRDVHDVCLKFSLKTSCCELWYEKSTADEVLQCSLT